MVMLARLHGQQNFALLAGKDQGGQKSRLTGCPAFNASLPLNVSSDAVARGNHGPSLQICVSILLLLKIDILTIGPRFGAT
jgi:hypothetical protein